VRDRIEGWRRTLKRAGLPAERQYVSEGDWSAEAARRGAAVLLDLPDPPTAMFATSLQILTGALAALREREVRVPQGVELMSSDDSEWLDVFEPRISVVLQPDYDMGQEAAKLLLERIEKPKGAPRSIVLTSSLKIRV